MYPEAKPRIISGVHSHLGDDARAHFALLFAIELQDGTLAQIAKIQVHPAGQTADQGRHGTLDSNLRGLLLYRTLAQGHRLCDAARYARRATGRNPRGTRS